MEPERLAELAEEQIERTLAELPGEIADAVSGVPVFVEELPSRDDIAGGIGADWLGLFEGEVVGRADWMQPPRIRIWTRNIWMYCGGREKHFREEVRVTLLHEIGHFLGLDEAGVKRLGLE